MTNVVPLDPERRLEVSLQPADLSVAQAAVAALVKGTQIPPSIEDLPAYKKTMAEFLARYPADVLLEAVNEAILNHKWLPGTNEMIKLCERLIAPRRAELDALKWAEDYERRAAAERAARRAEREQLQAERERDAQAQRARREAKIRWLQGIEDRARRRFGDAGPLEGDVALADSISNSLVSRAGSRIAWHAALGRSEEWAAKFCRLMALAARIRDAVQEGRARWDIGLALAKKLRTDEAEVRRLIDEIERRPGGTGEMLTESFWVELWRVHRACGCDVPADVVFPEDLAAALQSARTAAAPLVDVREILDRQFAEEWERRPGRLVSSGPPETAKEQQ
jgi:hypothetical protein